MHLARREAARSQRWTLLGRAWPLARQLAQLAVLVFAFSEVLDLGIDDYPAFVFCGLIAWTWFATGLGAASRSLLANAHLLRQPAFPAMVLPLVAATVPLLDVLVALPVLAAIVAVRDGLALAALALPVLLAVQFVLTAGLALIAGSLAVYLRDVPNLVALATMLLFYVTPVFYPLSRVPEDYRWALELNPVAQLLEAYRAVLLDGRWPDGGTLALLAAAAALTAVAGAAVFRRLEPGVVDRL